MTKEELVKLQTTQYNILKDVVALCEQYEITYYLAYGTLLGAVRHQGTIPWDYDIDIFMTRSNLEKFLTISHELSEAYEISSVGSGKNNAMGLMRVYKKGSLIYTDEHGREGAHAIHIDIFVLDCAKEYPKITRKIVNAIVKYLSIAKLSGYEKQWLYELWQDSFLKKAVCKSGDLLKLFIKESTIEIWIHKLLVQHNLNLSDNKKLVVVLYPRQIYLENYFGEGVDIKYEDRFFKAPKKSDELLKMWYGDYNQLPPEEERFTSNMERWIVEF